MNIVEIQDQVIEEFSVFDQWMERYEYLIELGKALEPLADECKRDENMVPGCQSRVWLNAYYQDGKVFFQADSDAIITQGIIALLIRVLSGQSAEDVVDADLYFIKAIGLSDHLSPMRSNGLVSMVERIKGLAKAFVV